MRRVIAVDADRDVVAIQIGNVELTFQVKFDGEKAVWPPRIIGRMKPGARVHDPEACWVPDRQFHKARQQAVKIATERRERAKPKQLSIPGV